MRCHGSCAVASVVADVTGDEGVHAASIDHEPGGVFPLDTSEWSPTLHA